MTFQKNANRVLGGVLVAFLIAAFLKYWYPGNLSIALLYVTLEAALIGGIADWFAVTALFKRPFGITWHTELVPRNRQRIAEALTTMVTTELLTVAVIRKRIAGQGFVAVLIDQIDRRGGARFLVRQLFGLVRSKKRKARATPARWLPGVLQRIIKQTDGAKLIDMLNRQGGYDILIAVVLAEFRQLAATAAFRQTVTEYLMVLKGEHSGSWLQKAVLWLGEQTDSINTGQAAQVLCDELLTFLQALADKAHPVRRWLVVKAMAAASALQNSGAWQDAAADWKFILQQYLDGGRLPKDVGNASLVPIALWMARKIRWYWAVLKQDCDLQIQLEARLKYVSYRLVQQQHHLIGQVTGDVLRNFSDHRLNQFIQDKAGQDLQWIRINGCIVGGIVGLALHLLLELLY